MSLALEIQSGKIKLITLTSSKIEQLRIWRNERENNEFLINKEEITKEAQLLWFKSIQLTDNLYFIIQYENQDVGLIYTSKTDLNNKTAETNLLIGESDFKKSGIALNSSLLFTDFLFNKAGLIQLKSIVNKHHKEGLDIDKFMGFRIDSKSEDFIYLSLNLDQFKNSKGYNLLSKLLKMNPVSIKK